jgi:hypothetical protein
MEGCHAVVLMFPLVHGYQSEKCFVTDAACDVVQKLGSVEREDAFHTCSLILFDWLFYYALYFSLWMYQQSDDKYRRMLGKELLLPETIDLIFLYYK